MSEEEIIERVKYVQSYILRIGNISSIEHNKICKENAKAIQKLIDLYQEQKQINQEHQKINGELRVKIKKLEEENSMLKGMFKKSIN